MEPIIIERGNRFLVYYDEYECKKKENGSIHKLRKQKTISFRRKKDAQICVRKIQEVHARGEHFVRANDKVHLALNIPMQNYCAAAGNPRTIRFRKQISRTFLKFIDKPQYPQTVKVMSREVLLAFAQSLPGDTRQSKNTRYRYIAEIEHFWAWAVDTGVEDIPHPAISIIKSNREFGPAEMPVPVDYPRWEQLDQMIGKLTMQWHRQVALILRYTGLRVSQVLSLQGSDINFQTRLLLIRAGAQGAKGSQFHRFIPIAPPLLEEMLTWNMPKEGPLFTNRLGKPPREGSLQEPFAKAWKAAHIPSAIWDAQDKAVEGGRATGRQTHAFRAAVKNGLLHAGVAMEIVDLVVGHKTPNTRRAYVSETTNNPFMQKMVEAVALIPPHKKLPPLEQG